MEKPPTLRSVARTLRLSLATVSLAMRDSARVNAETRARVRKAAKACGYRYNPLLGSALSAVRRSAHQKYRGTLGLITVAENGHILPPFLRAVVSGAEARAGTLSFKTELFWVGEREMTLQRLSGILRARAIQGVVILPFREPHDFSDLDFSTLAAAAMDHCLIRPLLHTVLPDHHLSMMNGLDRLYQRGYRRPGLFIEQMKDSRLLNRWTSAFLGWQQHIPVADRVPILCETKLNSSLFLGWFEKHQPDVVVGHLSEAIHWLAQRGLRVPSDVGLLSMNYTDQTLACTALDLQPSLLGGTAVESVVAQIQRSERGIPLFPKIVGIQAGWVEGPTLRPAAGL